MFQTRIGQRKMKSHMLLVSLALFAAGCVDSPIEDSAVDQITAIPDFAQIEQTANSLAESSNFSGVMLVAKEGEIALNKGYGFAQVERELPNTEQTQFRIASLSKTFTAALVLQLAEEGKLQLDATVADQLPEYKAEYSRDVTLLHLLTHRSGISHYIDLPGWFDGTYAQTKDRQAFIDTVAALPLNSEPGTAFRYSNANYFLLGMIVEKATGLSFEDALNARIIGPLGLTSTGHLSDATVLSDLAQNYIPDGSGGFVKGGPLNNNLFTATASMYSTSSDLLKWTNSFAEPGLLNANSLGMMLNPDDPIGWSVLGKTPEGDTVWAYNGEIEGYTSFVLLDPASRTTVIVLDNKSAGFETIQRISVELLTASYADDAE